MTTIDQEAQSLIERFRQSVAEERQADRAQRGIAEPEGAYSQQEEAFISEEVIRRLGSAQRITGAALLLALWRFYLSGQWMLVGEFDSFGEWAESAAPYIEEDYLTQFLSVIEHLFPFVHANDLQYRGDRLTPERLMAEAGVWRLINMTGTVRREADPQRKQEHLLAMLAAPSREALRDYIRQVQHEALPIRLAYFVVLQPDGTRLVTLVDLNDEQFRLFQLLTHPHAQELLTMNHPRSREVEALVEGLRQEGIVAAAT